MTEKLVKDRPFIQQSVLTDRWWFVASWRPIIGSDMRIAHTKFDITDLIRQIISDHGGDPT